MNIKKLLIGIFLILLLCGAILGFLYVKQSPQFTYEIKTHELSEKMEELPMEFNTDSEATIGFKVVFTDDRDNSEKARLALETTPSNMPPFLTYGDTLTIQLVNKDQIAEDDQIIYEISGTISSLRPGQYKLKIIDPNGNLVDEKVVTIK